MPLPDGAPEVHALITDTFNDVTGTHNWRASVQNDLPIASVLITQGEQQTHIAIFTEQGSYTLIADNKTGKATLVDEGKLIARQALVDDGVVLHEHAELTPPLTPQLMRPCYTCSVQEITAPFLLVLLGCMKRQGLEFVIVFLIVQALFALCISLKLR